MGAQPVRPGLKAHVACSMHTQRETLLGARVTRVSAASPRMRALLDPPGLGLPRVLALEVDPHDVQRGELLAVQLADELPLADLLRPCRHEQPDDVHLVALAAEEARHLLLGDLRRALLGARFGLV